MTFIIEIRNKEERLLQRIVPVKSEDQRGYEIISGNFKRVYPVNSPSQVADQIRYSLPLRSDLPEEYSGARVVTLDDELSKWLGENAKVI